MKHLILFIVITGFFMAGPVFPAAADEPMAEKTAIELDQFEVEGSLGDILATFKLNEMEIIGGMVGPSATYNKPWTDPVPFSERTADLTRGLIERHYTPLDRDTLSQQISIIIGPDETPRESRPPKATTLLSKP